MLRAVELTIGGAETAPPQLLHVCSKPHDRQNPVQGNQEAVPACLENAGMYLVVPALEVVMAFRGEHPVIRFGDADHFLGACRNSGKACCMRFNDEAKVEDIDRGRARYALDQCPELGIGRSLHDRAASHMPCDQASLFD